MNTQQAATLNLLAHARIAMVIVVSGLALLLDGCGGGDNNKSSMPVSSSPTPPASTGLLTGTDATLASKALTNLRDHAVGSSDITGTYLMTRLVVRLQPTTTVAQFNAATKVVGATAITSSAIDSPDVVVSIPNPGSVAALQSLAKMMRNQTGIAFAWPGQMLQTSVLPETAPGISISTTEVNHLLATRFPQAWNARNAAPQDCLPRSVSVFVFDVFGDIGNRPKFQSQIWTNDFAFSGEGAGPGSLGGEEGHGFDVALTLGAKFDGIMPTGADPFQDCVLMTQLEVGGYDMTDAIRGVMATVAADPDLHVILTSSVNFPDEALCGANADEVCSANNIAVAADFLRGTLQTHAMEAGAWGAQMRNRHLTDKALVTQAAGNINSDPHGFLARNYLGFRSASFSSPAAFATHLADLQSILTDRTLWTSPTPGLPDLTFTDDQAAQVVQMLKDWDEDHSLTASNLLIVDSGTDAESLKDVEQSEFSMLGADVRAVGQNVVTTDGALLDGTSFSTPTVAGLAAYLWNLSPDLNSQPVSATVDFIRQSSVTTAKSPTVPVIDAYAAVLSLDPAAIPTPSTALIREQLLDVNGDNKFDEADIDEFLRHLFLLNPDGTISNIPAQSSNRDFSRFDLNGDGFTTAAPLFERFDLDRLNSTQYGAATYGDVSENIEGQEIHFNETAVSDLQILCYYAYSPMFSPAGSTDTRKSLLAGRCGMSVSPATATLTVSTTKTFTATSPANDPVTWSASCGTISSTGPTTGFFTAPATPGTCVVTATSTLNTALSGTATITVNAISGQFFSGLLTLTMDDTDGEAGDSDHWVYTTQIRAQLLADGTLAVVSATGTFTRNLLYPTSCRDSKGQVHRGINSQTVSDTIGGGQFSGYNFRPLITTLTIDNSGMDPFQDCMVVSTSDTSSNPFLDQTPFLGTPMAQGVPVSQFDVVHGATVTAIDFNATFNGQCTPRSLPHGVCTTTGQLLPTQ